MAIKKRRISPWLSLPVVLVPIAFLMLAPGFKATYPALFPVAASAIFLLLFVYAFILYRLRRAAMDEVQIAASGSASQWGTRAGTVIFILLMLLPPFWDFVTVLVANLPGNPSADRQTVQAAVWVGCAGVVLLQVLGNLIAYGLWWAGKR